MIILALDTALSACSVAVFDGAVTLAFESELIERGHAEALVPMIARVMRQSSKDFSDLTRIVVTTGPGSFTGLRVALASARALRLALGIPAVGISTLASLAEGSDVPTLAAIDARHGRVYAQMFPNGSPCLVAARDLPEDIAPQRIVGSGAALIADRFPQAVCAPLPFPNIISVARLGAKALPDMRPPAPLYLQEADARPQFHHVLSRA